MSSIAISDTINTTPRYHVNTGGFPREGLSPSYTSHCLFSPSLIVSALPARLTENTCGSCSVSLEGNL